MILSIEEKIALVASVVLPLWNIPLIIKIIRRRSSGDISVPWAVGVWACLFLMFPAGLRSEDIVWRTFNIVNFTLFSAVVVTVLRYRSRDKKYE